MRRIVMAKLLELEAKERELEKALAEGEEIAQKSDLNDEERVDLRARMAKIEELREEIKDAEKASEIWGKENGASEEDIEVTRYSNKSMGEQFVESEEFLRHKAEGFRGNGAAYVVKAEPTPITSVGDSSAVPGLSVPERIGTIYPLPSYPTRVLDLLPKLTTGGNMVTYYEETSETTDMGPALEGAEKPNFTLDGEEKSEAVQVIGAMAAITRQTLSDLPFMAGFVNTRMTLRLDKVREFEILAGDGADGDLYGFSKRGDNGELSQQAASGSTALDTIDGIYKAADKCWVDGGYPADAVIINPIDWQPIVLSKDGNDRYYGTGPFAAAVGDTIWGLTVVKSPFQKDNVLVGAFAAGAFFVRNGGTELRTSDSHADYFKKNKVAVLIEERGALVVVAPKAFCELQGDFES
jgi:HK97 family phage major capsid protein